MEVKLLYILSGNLSTTPRALQSIITAKQLYKVEVLGVNRTAVWEKMDKVLIDEQGIHYKTVSLGRKPFVPWLLSSIVHKMAQKLAPLFTTSLRLNAYASSKTAFLLNRKLKTYTQNYDLVIAHSYGSFYPAYAFAQNNKAPFIVDIEDYHPGESVLVSQKEETERRKHLLAQLLPKARHITYASPLIGKYTLNLLDNLPKHKHTLINNCFSSSEFQLKENNAEKLNLVWFSQNIAASRGLEIVVPKLYQYKSKINLVLIGYLYQDFYDDFLSQFKDILTILPPLSQHDLHQKICEFDIGLALEIKTTDKNRDLCLTNKIFAYAQSGLFILATDTQAQSAFLNQYSALGMLFDSSSQGFEKPLEFIINNKEAIRDNKSKRYAYAKTLSWENESRKLIQIWKEILQ